MSKTVDNPVCVYDFTASADSNNEKSIKESLKEHCKKWCFQEEKGDSGFHHFQGRFSLKLKTRLNCACKLFNGWHLSITSNENRDNNFYVTKSDSRINGPWSDSDVEIYVPRQLREISILHPWQSSLVMDSNRWDTRTINILFDQHGNIGKSILKTYIGVSGIGRALPYSNDYKDIMRMVMDTEKRKLYIIDIPRALRKEQMFQFFSGIETLKDGYAYDDRYKFREEYFDCPNIWIFMNTIPSRDYLSKDRWKLWTVIDLHLCPYIFDTSNPITAPRDSSI